MRSRTIAYGENTYDFTGRKERPSLDFIEPEVTYRTYSNADAGTPTTADNTTKILLILAVGGVAFTGLLIWIFGRRKK
jgi:LPXTG-motif cell wall-anchored protein